jgi:heptosyltransferase-1
VQRSRLLCAKALRYELSPDELQRAHYGLIPGALALAPVAHATATAAHMHAHGSEGNPFVPRKPIVALVHGTSRADKEWPLASWIALGQRLNHSGFAVALPHGNPAERATSEAIAAQLDDAWVWPTLALDAITDTMARCAGVVGVDSGLSHIAVALDLPHVQIYNFDTAWRTGPQDDPSARQVSVFASPQPSVDAVWDAWEGLATPVLCR